MTYKTSESSELQPAGAGLPSLERNALNVAFKLAAAVVGDRVALKKFQRESNELIRLTCDDDSYDVFQPYLIPRVIGIEDSSRKWSVMMVLQHLCLVNADILKIIKALIGGIVPRGEIDLAMYKPDEDLGYEVLDRFREIDLEYRIMVDMFLESRGNLKSIARYPHPWFGPLDAHQWHCLAAVHQQIHRRQMQKIVAMLGVT